MNPTTRSVETLDDLMRAEGKAELIGGRVVRYMASGYKPTHVAFEIAVSLREYAHRTGVGLAFPDGVGYALDPPLPNGRQSFQPDASYHTGPLPANEMRFFEGTPVFAVEVRSENDHGPSAEVAMAAKRADYFDAGTLAVWDVDPEARTVALYLGDAENPAVVYGSGDIAEAGPAVPGWRVAVDDLFA